MKGVFLGITIAVVLIMSMSPVYGAEPINVGLAWVGKSGMAGRVTKGIEQGIQELAPEIKIDYQKELPTIEALEALVSRWENEKKAMIILRSNGAEWLGANPPRIPAFIGACSHPVHLGAVKSLKAPGVNVSGVTYYLELDTPYEIYRAILPELKSVLLLVEAGHPGAPIDQEATQEICARLGISYSERQCYIKEDAIQAVREAGGKVSAVIIGNQALVIDNAKDIVAAAGKMPVLSYSSNPVKQGALGGFVADDVKLGYMLAESLIDVVKSGKDIKRMPIKTDRRPTFFVNVATAQNLGIEIPYDILETATIIE